MSPNALSRFGKVEQQKPVNKVMGLMRDKLRELPGQKH
jgi:hypothetical protein